MSKNFFVFLQKKCANELFLTNLIFKISDRSNFRIILFKVSINTYVFFAQILKTYGFPLAAIPDLLKSSCRYYKRFFS